MPRNHRAVSTFLIVGISILFFIASVHSNYDRLLEADFLGRGVKFEAADIEDPLVDKQTILNFIAGESCIFDSLAGDLHRLLNISPWQIISLGLSFSPLRC